MAPPYKLPKTYFANDVRAYVKTHRPTWKKAGIENTINALWYKFPALEDYYKDCCNKQSPSLPGIPDYVTIPPRAHTKKEAQDARHMRSTGPDQYPFSFWPSHPWPSSPSEDSLVDFDALMDRKGKENKELAEANFLGQELDYHPSDDENNTWMGAQLLGKGSFGCAGLWVKRNEEGFITNRIVTKEVACTRRTWRDPIMWRDRLPREIAMHRRIDGLPPAIGPKRRNVIRHRSHRLMMRKRRYRLYLDYCDGGSMSVPFRDLCARREDENFRNLNRLGEGFIWHVLKSLVSACLVLHGGPELLRQDLSRPSNGSEEELGEDGEEDQEGTNETRVSVEEIAKLSRQWKEITHLDISMRNIFLNLLSNQDWPEIVLADFGLAMTTLNYSEDDSECDNPREYHILQEDYRLPPEYLFPQDPPMKLEAKTNVWQVGAVIHQLITHEPENKGPRIYRNRPGEKTADGPGGRHFLPVAQRPLKRPLTPHDLFPMDKFPVAQYYSKELKEIVTRCLNFWQRDRPTLRDLESRINKHLSAHPELMNQADNPSYMEKSTSKRPFDIGKRIVSWTESENFSLNSKPSNPDGPAVHGSRRHHTESYNDSLGPPSHDPLNDSPIGMDDSSSMY